MAAGEEKLLRDLAEKRHLRHAALLEVVDDRAELRDVDRPMIGRHFCKLRIRVRQERDGADLDAERLRRLCANDRQTSDAGQKTDFLQKFPLRFLELLFVLAALAADAAIHIAQKAQEMLDLFRRVDLLLDDGDRLREAQP